MAVASRVRVTPGFLMARLAGVSPKQTPAHAPQRMHRSRPNGRTMVGRSSTGLAGGACLWHRSLPTHRTGLPLHAHATGHATAGRRSEDLQPRPFGWLRGLRRGAVAALWSVVFLTNSSDILFLQHRLFRKTEMVVGNEKGQLPTNG